MNKKNIYVCGPTVYSHVHIGNMRPIITFDVYNRSLRALGNEVNFIHNITDIDDKIINRAIEEGKTEKEVSDFYTERYNDVLSSANIDTITHQPNIADNLEGMIDYISELIDKGAAYVVDGNVFFDVNSIEYGTVSNQNLEKMIFEESSHSKKHPADFALWKSTSVGVQFDSPWGKGRPGWHTECAYFINKHNDGKTLDIHGGGIDLIFPHHENENAQHLAYHGEPIANDWKHVGHIFMSGEKMSKSLGNVVLAKDFIKEYSADLLRLLFISSSPFSPLEVSDEFIDNLKKVLSRLEKVHNKSQILFGEIDVNQEVIKDLAKDISEWKFASVLRKMNENIKKFNKNEDFDSAQFIESFIMLIGFNMFENKLDPYLIGVFNEWNKAREAKDWEKADNLRQKLKKLNI